MTRFFRRVQKKLALPPGTVEYAGEKKVEKVTISVINYDEIHFEEKELASAEECFPYKDTKHVSWINVNGLHETKVLEELGDHFGLHPLILEDIVNTHQRPKMEDHQKYIYIVLKMLHHDVDKNLVTAEQVSIVLGFNYVLSFQERPGDLFEPVRERIRKAKVRIRKMGADYLAYALIDAIVDNYFVILEKFGEQVESLEEGLVDNPAPSQLEQIHQVKREMIFLRKSIWPLREVISSLERGETKLIRKGMGVFLRDVYDHTIQVIDAVESFRDVTSGMQDLYLSSISNKMNEVMKVLTIIATIFIPITFVAGIYGMNFEFMPELKWRWSYPIVWAIIAGVFFGMLTYFRRKRWI
ncbi:MAG: magnesium/cobalt transporter CorA [Candidatus Latescibacteria bacterium]|nr:magnesium/cobalt transporter CorA [Candidatus Latescibacterota bacterium]NIO57355.1 magnesium/cobalt transporter CorA [Candidatus Latescibacterota bacterium]